MTTHRLRVRNSRPAAARLRRAAAAVALGAVALPLAAWAPAAEFAWQTAGTTDTWSNSAGDANWFIDGGTTLAPWVDGNNATFAGATGETVTLSGGVSPTLATVGAGNGTWTFAGNGPIGGSLVKTGTGTLTFTTASANSFSDVTINGGLVSIGIGGTAGPTAAADSLGTGTVTINAGGTLQFWVQNNVTTTYQNNLVVNGGTVLAQDGTGQVSGTVTVGSTGATLLGKWGGKNLILSNVISGSGPVTVGRQAGGEATAGVVFAADNTYTGATTVTGGLLILGNQTASGSLATSASLAVNAGGMIIRRTGSVNASAVLPANTTFAATTTFEVNSTDGFGTFNIDKVIGTVAAPLSTFKASGGIVGITDGGSVVADTLSLVVQSPINIGTFNVTGGSLASKFFNFGDGTNQAGFINQSGGTVTALAGSSGIRIGHWNNTLNPASAYNLTGGTLDATPLAANAGTARPINVGWDGPGTMTVGGGPTVATAKAWGIQLDANGDNTGFNDTLTVNPNGVVEIGAGGLLGASVNDNVMLGGGTLRATAAGSTWSAAVSVNADSTIGATAGSRAIVSGIVTGGSNLAQTGAGEVSYTGNFTGYSGAITTAAGSTMSGTATLGSVTVNGTLAPGASAATGAAGTLTLGANGGTATVNGNTLFDLNGASTTTGNDLVAAVGNLTFGAGATVKPTFFGVTPVSGSKYTLFTYGGTLAGAPTIDPAAATSTRLAYAVDTTTNPGQVLLSVTGQAGNLVWAGNGTTNVWDVNTTAHWLNGATPDKFFQGDAVSFTDTGDNTVPVNVTGQVTPITIAVSAAKNYTFAGTGSIAGNPGLTKSGTGSLTVSVPSALGTVAVTGGSVSLLSTTSTGATTITGSTVTVGNGGTSGTLDGTATVTVGDGATLRFNRSDASTYSRPSDAASTGTLAKAGTGNLTIGAFVLLPTNVVVEAGTMTMTGGGFGGNRLNGAGTLTVNPGATLVLAAGNAHALGGSNAGMTDAVVVNGGTLTANQEQYFNKLTLSGATVNGTGEVRVSNASDFQVTGTAPSTVSNTVVHYNTANWTVADVTGSPAADVTLSGTINVSGTAPVLNKAGPGTMVLTGLNNNANGTNVNAGTLVANNASGTGSGPVTVAAGAVLAGTGTITPGTVAAPTTGTVSITGTLAPGNPGAVGTMTISSAGTTAASVLSLLTGGSLAIDLGPGTTSDVLAVTGAAAGDVSFVGNAVNVANLSGGPLAGGTYTIVTADVAGAYTGLTTDANGVITSGLTIGTGLEAYPLSSLSVVGNNIALNVVVPEPGPVVGAALMGLGLLARRRRTRAR